MLVEELIGILKDLPKDAELKIGFSPSYPKSSNIFGIWEPVGENANNPENANTLYLLAGEASHYLPRDAWDEAYTM